MMETKKLTTHPPARVMPTGSGRGALGGNQTNNSYAKNAEAEDHLAGFDIMPQNVIDIELCLRITSGFTTLTSYVKAR
jgi:hypothetical protein